MLQKNGCIKNYKENEDARVFFKALWNDGRFSVMYLLSAAYKDPCLGYAYSPCCDCCPFLVAEEMASKESILHIESKSILPF